MNLGRHIRPFPIRALVSKVGLVQTRSSTLQEELTAAITGNTWEPVEWRHSMFLLMNVLDGISEAAIDARAHCEELYASADRDHEAAGKAAVAMLRGLVEAETRMVEQRRAGFRVVDGEEAA